MLRILVYGYRNPKLQDQRLGLAFTENIAKLWQSSVLMESKLSHELTTAFSYDLKIEDVHHLADKDLVIFVASCRADISCLWLKPIEKLSSIVYVTQAMRPEAFLGLCYELYGRIPVAYTLSIRGYSWELNEDLTQQAHDNLEQALATMMPRILQPRTLFYKSELPKKI